MENKKEQNCGCNVRVTTCVLCGEKFCKHYSTTLNYSVCYSCVEKLVENAVKEAKK